MKKTSNIIYLKFSRKKSNSIYKSDAQCITWTNENLKKKENDIKREVIISKYNDQSYALWKDEPILTIKQG